VAGTIPLLDEMVLVLPLAGGRLACRNFLGTTSWTRQERQMSSISFSISGPFFFFRF